MSLEVKDVARWERRPGSEMSSMRHLVGLVQREEWLLVLSSDYYAARIVMARRELFSA